MGPKRYLWPVLLLVGICILAWHGPTGAQDKVITFTKDIDVVPNNPNPAKRINVRLGVDKTQVQPGDTVSVSFETDRDSYLTLLDLGTSGKITRLWPNQFSGPDNFVKAKKRYSFPASQDKFQFKVSGPHGIERIVALATLEKDRIIREEEFSEYRQGFKSLPGQIKDLVVEARRRTSELPDNVKWGTATVGLTVGKVPEGGRITSANVYLVSVGAATGALRYCEDDAAQFARLMNEKLRIPGDNVRLLVGRQATRSGFEDAIRWLAGKSQPEDLVFIYFSGHGTLIPDPPNVHHDDGLSAAFVCYHEKQTLRRDDPDLKQILLPGPEFAVLLKDVPARRRIFVVDSCHSGSIHKEISPNLVSKYLPLLSPSEMKELQIVATQRAGSARVSAERYGEFLDSKETLLAACEKKEQSYEDRAKRSGLFTYWLSSSIKAGSQDLRVASEDAKLKVIDETRGVGPQTPQIEDEHGLARDIKF